MRRRIYVAGPLSTGKLVENIRPAVVASQRLLELGYAVFCPHLSHFWEILSGKESCWDDWLEMDEAWIAVSDAVLRIPGVSHGADREVAFAKAAGIPVYRSILRLSQAIPPRGPAAEEVD